CDLAGASGRPRSARASIRLAVPCGCCNSCAVERCMRACQVHAVNEAGSLDRLPRSHLRLGDRTVPVYFFFGTLGLAVGFLIALFVALANALSSLLIFGATIAGVLLFLTHNFLRRQLTGAETIFQLEHLLVQLLFYCVVF